MRVRGSARLERMPLAIDVVAFMIIVYFVIFVVDGNLKSKAGDVSRHFTHQGTTYSTYIYHLSADKAAPLLAFLSTLLKRSKQRLSGM